MNEEKKEKTTQEATRSDQGLREQRLRLVCIFWPMSVVGDVFVNFSQQLGSRFLLFS